MARLYCSYAGLVYSSIAAGERGAKLTQQTMNPRQGQRSEWRLWCSDLSQRDDDDGIPSRDSRCDSDIKRGRILTARRVASNLSIRSLSVIV